MKYHTNFSDSLHKITQYNFKENISFVFYKKPGDEVLSYIEVKDVGELAIDDLNSQSYFLFAPFDLARNPIKAFKYETKLLDQEILDYAATLPLLSEQNSLLKESSNVVASQTDFVNLVELIKSKIEQGECKKIIASRIFVEASKDKVIEGFLRLCDQYNHSFNYLIYVAGDCCWIGASPEVLLSCRNSEMKTMSLAGTQLAKEGTIHYDWKDKEKVEQQIVTDYIESVLQKIGLSSIRVSEPYTFQAANLVHLKSDISASISKEEDLLKVLKGLHPTPAVCGLPKEEAVAFIEAHEQHNRKYYTGFIGEWNGIKHTDLFVNLRCAEVTPNSISYYVGCGITSGSESENEWEETERKIDTLKSVLKA